MVQTLGCPTCGRTPTHRTGTDHDEPTADSGLAVMIALRDPVTRVGAEVMLERVSVVREVVTCENADHARRSLTRRQADILMVSFPMDDDLADVAMSSGTKILALLEDTDVANVGCCSAADPDGFVLRSALTPDLLLDTIVRMENGELPAPAIVIRELLAKTRGKVKGPPSPFTSWDALTARERQVLELLAQGCSNKQISSQLGASENGVKRHVANILAKLNCPNRTLAVAWALRNGIIDATAPTRARRADLHQPRIGRTRRRT